MGLGRGRFGESGFVAAFSKEARRSVAKRKHDREWEKLGQQIGDQISRGISQAKIAQANELSVACVRFLKACDELKAAQAESRSAQRDG